MSEETEEWDGRNEYDKRRDELVELSSLDESESYETDVTSIHLEESTGKFILINASGCSCWDGDYTETQYDSLDAIELFLLGEESERMRKVLTLDSSCVARYCDCDKTGNASCASFKGCMELVRDAKAKLESIGGRYVN